MTTSNTELSTDALKQKLIADATGVNIGQMKTERITFPTEIIDLPSKGLVYPEAHPLSSGRIEMKYMTTREEDILTSQNLIKKDIALDKFIQSLVVTNVNLDELVSGDYDALLIASRILGYGPVHTFKTKCPMCGETTPCQYDIREFKDKPVDLSKFKPHSGVFSITLPSSNAIVELQLLTKQIDNAISEELKGLSKLNLEYLPEYSTRLKHTIVSVNGNSDTKVIRKFVDEMLAPDSRFIREQIRLHTPGIDTHFPFTCDNSDCNYSQDLLVPIDISFFWPGA